MGYFFRRWSFRQNRPRKTRVTLKVATVTAFVLIAAVVFGAFT